MPKERILKIGEVYRLLMYLRMDHEFKNGNFN